MIARLRAAEEEAARLKKELAVAQAAVSCGASAGVWEKCRLPLLPLLPAPLVRPPACPLCSSSHLGLPAPHKNTLQAGAAGLEGAAADADRPTSRIDGGDLRRETLFSVESRQRNWLSEGDVSFFTGGGPSEAAAGEAASEEEQETVKVGGWGEVREGGREGAVRRVGAGRQAAPPHRARPPPGALPTLQRRLLLGLLASMGLAAFALVPTQQLQLSKPSKPLFFYIVPLLR
jgi:hypothetical protein